MLIPTGSLQSNLYSEFSRSIKWSNSIFFNFYIKYANVLNIVFGLLLQVHTNNAGNGTLSVAIHGPRSHTVTETSVLYTGDNLYEIFYEVNKPGYYIISVKWSEVNVPNSPFICKVSY